MALFYENADSHCLHNGLIFSQVQLKPGYNAGILNYIRSEFKINELPAWIRSLVVYTVKTIAILLICRDELVLLIIFIIVATAPCVVSAVVIAV